ncbi:MAG TPA: hypothetical protein DCO86_02160 [Spirochaetaceae bacterium]|nr:hypothetical protein [Spirochaetaceae bacterium]
MRKISKVGRIVLGDGRVAIQSMFKKPLRAYSEASLKRLYNMGCDIMRFSISDESEDEIRSFVRRCDDLFPLVSDIQGSVSQAVRSLKAGCSAIRLNPANFRISDLESITELAGERNAAIRIGINEGSLDDRSDDAIIRFFDDYVSFFESRRFENLVLSVKSSDYSRTLFINRLIGERFGYPMHVGLTEAGDICVSAVRTTMVLCDLIKTGRIDTIRYSISGSEESEVRCAYEFLRTLGNASGDFQIVSCPMCARAGADVEEFDRMVENFVFDNFDIRGLNLKLAIMGCPVNGIKEAEDADVAVCATKSGYAIYRDGKLECNVCEKTEFESLFVETVSNAIKERAIGRKSI